MQPKRSSLTARLADICLVEVGGTVGDIESMPFLEAVRQMRGELDECDYVLIHVTLVPEDAMGDLKTKPTQHSVKALRELGLHADIIVCRSERVVGSNTKAQDLGLLRSSHQRGYLGRDRTRHLRGSHGDGKGGYCRCPLHPPWPRKAGDRSLVVPAR